LQQLNTFKHTKHTTDADKNANHNTLPPFTHHTTTQRICVHHYASDSIQMHMQTHPYSLHAHPYDVNGLPLQSLQSLTVVNFNSQPNDTDVAPTYQRLPATASQSIRERTSRSWQDPYWSERPCSDPHALQKGLVDALSIISQARSSKSIVSGSCSADCHQR
jgi:hypothetical protein